LTVLRKQILFATCETCAVGSGLIRKSLLQMDLGLGTRQDTYRNETKPA